MFDDTVQAVIDRVDRLRSQVDDHWQIPRDEARVTDNTTTHAAELASFVGRLRSLPGFTSCNVPVGNGFELTVRIG